MRLAQLSDCHLLGDKQASLYQVNPYQSLVKVLQLVALQQPDAVLITGDISGDDTPASYSHLIQAMAEYLPGVPWKVIAGNHDNNSCFSDYLGEAELRACAPWALQNWLLHGLDTRFEGARGQIREAELRTIENSIHVSPKSVKHILVLHHHLMPTQSWMDKHALENGELVLNWLDEMPDVLLVLHGHIHAERSSRSTYATVLSTPSTCWQWQLSPEFAVEQQPPGYREFYLGQHGEWSSTVRRVP